MRILSARLLLCLDKNDLGRITILMKALGTNEIREKYLSFFETKDHLRLPSFSLVPKDDAHEEVVYGNGNTTSSTRYDMSKMHSYAGH